MPGKRKMPQPEAPLPPGDHEVQEGEEIVPEDMPQGWQLAYQRAIVKGCSEKAARIYAEAHGEEFEPTGNAHNAEPKKELTVEEINAEIVRLQELREQADAGGSS